MTISIQWQCVLFLVSLSGVFCAPLTLAAKSSLKQNEYRLTNKLRVCNNHIVHNISGSYETVYNTGLHYLKWMKQNENQQLSLFTGAWRDELLRVMGPKIAECPSLTVFGDEKLNYDEAKRFCFLSGRTESDKCSVYSVGSNNKWDFEQNMIQNSFCNISTFDCTLDVVVPTNIRNRTAFYKKCLGASNQVSSKGWAYLNMKQINHMQRKRNGPHYLKMDVEGFEWSILKSWLQPPIDHSQLPQQLYIEFHLDRDVSPQDSTRISNLPPREAYVGQKLRNFFNELFIQAGYMIMHVRNTVQTRNIDVLLVKAFC